MFFLEIKKSLVLLCFFALLKAEEDFENLTVPILDVNGDEIEMDLIEFITRGSEQMSKELDLYPKENVVMILGLSGTGKSTLVNYLLNVPLVCLNVGDTWRIQIDKSVNSSLIYAKIGGQSISETIYPSAYSTPIEDFSYLDTPGFSDNRGLGMEIANGYFRKIILDKVKFIKMVFLIEQSDLQGRGSQFYQTLKRISEFVGIFEKQNSKLIAKSIGAIITKVDNDGKSDQEIINYQTKKIAELLKQGVRNRQITKMEKSIYEEALLNGNIKLFSNPKKQIALESFQRDEILAMIKNLEYTSIDDADIRVSIDPKYIQELESYVSLSKRKFLEKLNKKLEKAFKNYILSLLNRDVDAQDLVPVNKLILYADLNVFQNKSFDEFMSDLESQTLSQNQKNDLIKEQILINYFTHILPNEESDTQRWISKDLSIKLNHLLEKYKIKIKKICKQLELEIEAILQVSLKKYFFDQVENAIDYTKIEDLESLLNELLKQIYDKKETKDFLINLDERFLSKKMEFLSKLNLIESFVFKLKPDFKWKSLLVTIKDLKEEVSNLKINHDLVFNEDKGQLTFKDHFVNISFVFKKINLLSTYKLKKVVVLATNTLVFDDDFKLSKRLYTEPKNHPDLIIISQYIKVIKNVTVDLSCETIPEYPKAINKSENGVYSGDHGSDGLPGLSGYNGGNFIVFTKNFIGSDKLTLLSIGGEGGEGQEGGDGIEGSKGRDVQDTDIPNPMSCWCCGCKCIPNEYFLYSDKIASLAWNNFYAKQGDPGYPGGNGGKGGCSGYGGLPGEIKILVNNNNNHLLLNISSQTKEGKKGEHGLPGKAGLGGFYGRELRIKCYASRWKRDEKLDYNWFSSYNRASSGYVQTQCSGNSLHSTKSEETNFYMIENEYLEYLNELSANFKNSQFIRQNFSKQIIEENFTKFDIYNLIERVQVLNNNESQYLYESLKNELIAHKGNSNDDEKKVIDFLLASIYSAELRHRSSQDTLLVLNVKDYIEMIFDHVKDWKGLTQQKIRKIYRKNYDNNLNKQIEDADYFIQILKEDIDFNIKQTHVNIALILKEIIKLKEEVKRNEVLLREKKEMLKKELKRKAILGGLKIFSDILSIFVPNVGLVLSGSLGIIDSAIPNGKNVKTGLSPQTDKIIQEYKKNIIELNNYQLSFIEKEIRVLEKVFKIQSLNTDSLEEKLERLPENRETLELKLKYENYMLISSENSSNEMKIKEKIKYLTEKINEYTNKKLFKKRAITPMITQIANADEQFKQKFDKIYNVAKLSTDLAHDLKISKSEIDQVEEEIIENANKYQILNKIEDHLSLFQRTILKSSHNELNYLTNELKKTSSTGIDFKKWHIKKNIDFFKVQLTSLTSVTISESNNHFLNTISGIESAITTILDIYNRIDSFRQQAKLVDFISNVLQNDIPINIPLEIKNEINELKRNIYANIIKERYHKAVEAFKYWSFPFYLCHKYEIESTKENEALITNMENILKNLLEQVKNDQIKLQPGLDNLIQYYMFEKDAPFYSWSSIDYDHEIRMLLRGEQALLLADVRNSNFDAVKFCTLFLQFKIMNSLDDDDKLNNILSNFFVELTHFGESNYKYNERFYSINSYYHGEKLMLRYQYGCRNNCTNANESYKKLEKNKPLLSPYAFWGIKLKPIDNKRNNLFEEINKIIQFNSEIEVTLNGYGQYIAEANNLKKLNMDCV